MMGFLTSPRLCFGPGAFEQLGALGVHRAALIVDPALAAGTVVRRIREELEKSDARVETIAEVRIEPDLESVESVAARVRAASPDWIVAIGGGSTIDTAKGAWIRYAQPELALDAVGPLAELRLRDRARFVALPSNAGSGSEATGMVHLQRPDGPLLEVGARELEPDWAMLVPELLASVPPDRAAEAGFDALAHAFEALASEWSNPFTAALAREAIGILLRELPRSLKRFGDTENLQSVQAAATMAGMAASNSQLGAAHAVAHALSAVLGVPHARAVATALPHVLEYNFPSARERYASLQAALGGPAVQAGPALGGKIRSVAEPLGIPRALVDAGVEGDRFRGERSRLIEYARASPSLVGNPRLPTPENLGRLFDLTVLGSTSST
ncbi:MAG TPA: iron-containing alcohol dehydrogenase [Thermoplasmata archaeon]|nr:iron-containing alcohol dehydrogenase [Thermoplasmata archaeon]